MYAVIRDISARKTAEQSLSLAAQVIENSHEGIMIAGQDRRIISVNQAATKITGYTVEEIKNAAPHMFFSAMHHDMLYGEIRKKLQADDHWEGELTDRRRNGEAYPLWLSITVVRDYNRNITHYFSIFSDITERKSQELHTRYMAEHDFLTGLPTRQLLLDRLEHAIAGAKRNGTQLAVLYIDLDRFKEINDSMGHATGDKLLQEVARRLNKNLRSVDTVSRQGGDEFVIMLSDIGAVSQVAHIADNIMKALAKPYQIDDYGINVTSSIGVSMYPGDGKDIDSLLKNADLAMYHAKASGRNNYQFFNDKMNARVAERLTLESSLKQAISRQEFILQYQPEMEIISGRMIGAEALIRWQHPDLGLLLPAYFMPVAEDCGLIVPIGDWVLRTACRQAKLWQDQGRPMVVSVNLSGPQFRQTNLFKSITNALGNAKLDPQYLELEITESMFTDCTKSTLNALDRLRKLGVKFALDDFGTGYSNFNGLKRYSIDKLKIDQSFMRDIISAPNEAAIIIAIIAMAKSLKLEVIAEGVETIEQFGFLESHGCDQYQGHYSSKALSAAELAAFGT